MTLITIPIGSILLLMAVSLLFVRRPKSGTDWPSFIGLCLLFATLALASWAWQYGKFTNQHGFYYFSPRYGGLILTIRSSRRCSATRLNSGVMCHAKLFALPTSRAPLLVSICWVSSTMRPTRPLTLMSWSSSPAISRPGDDWANSSDTPQEGSSTSAS
jgi:hypothetical protein